MITLFAAIVAVLAALTVAMRSGGLARLGGARPDLLDRAVVDSSAFTARGIAVIIPALFGSFAMTVALGYGQQLKLTQAAVGGAAWGLIVLFFDLSIMNADVGGNSALSWLRGVIFLALRATAAILGALVFSFMIALFWFRTDIATQVQRDNQAAALTYDRSYIAPHYTPQINQDKLQAAAGQNRLYTDTRAVATARKTVDRTWLLVKCEKGGVSNLAGCPAGSGKVGSGPVTAVRVTEYDNAQAVLTHVETTQQLDQARLLPQISQDQANATALQDKLNQAEAAQLTLQAGHDGLLARQRALSELEYANPAVGDTVKVMELLIIAIDCSAVIAKITSRTRAYDRVAQAATYVAVRCAERDEAFIDTEIQAQTRVQRAWWQARGDAAEDRITAWREQDRNRWSQAGWQQESAGRGQGEAGQAGGQQPGPEPSADPSETPPSGARDAEDGGGWQQESAGRGQGEAGQAGGQQPGPEPSADPSETPPSGARDAEDGGGWQQESAGRGQGEAGQAGGQQPGPEPSADPSETPPSGARDAEDGGGWQQESAGRGQGEAGQAGAQQPGPEPSADPSGLRASNDPYGDIRDRLGWEET